MLPQNYSSRTFSARLGACCLRRSTSAQLVRRFSEKAAIDLKTGGRGSGLALRLRAVTTEGRPPWGVLIQLIIDMFCLGQHDCPCWRFDVEHRAGPLGVSGWPTKIDLRMGIGRSRPTKAGEARPRRCRLPAICLTRSARKVRRFASWPSVPASRSVASSPPPPLRLIFSAR